MILKQCRECRQKYPGNLKDPFNLCPEHNIKENRERMISSFKRTRSINVDHYDVWNDDYKYGNGNIERACRVCGGRMLNKNGRASHHKRYCHRPCGYGDLLIGKGQDCLERNFERHEVYITLTRFELYLNTKHRSHYSSFRPTSGQCCEKCMKVLSYGQMEIHHLFPVCMVDESNYQLIWDQDNLQVLCHDCHAKAEGHKLFRVKKTPKIDQKYKKLEYWLK